MITAKCLSCKKEFQARLADRKRGWAKFCSKSCKATRQFKLTGVSGPYHIEREFSDEIEGWDGHK